MYSKKDLICFVMGRNPQGRTDHQKKKTHYDKPPCNFTLVDVQASFGHVSHPSLGLLGREGVEVVDKRRLICDLKVPDAAVTLKRKKKNICPLKLLNLLAETLLHYFRGEITLKVTHLSTQVDDVCVGVIERQQDTVARVHLLDTNGLVHVVLDI